MRSIRGMLKKKDKKQDTQQVNKRQARKKFKVVLKNRKTGKTAKYFVKARNKTNAGLLIFTPKQANWLLHHVVER